MTRAAWTVALITSVFFTDQCIAHAIRSPCGGVDRKLTVDDQARLSARLNQQFVFAKQTARAMERFRFRGWSIVYAYDDTSDPFFAFYRGDPLTTKSLAIWGGAAGSNEENEIRLWVTKNAPGIPAQLATCFAWHVTGDRDF